MRNKYHQQIVSKIRNIKCQQKDCLSSNSENISAFVLQNQFKRQGGICTSCLIDQQLFKSFQDAQLHALSLEKFLKVIANSYAIYSEKRKQQEWPPTKFNVQRNSIKDKLTDLQKVFKEGAQKIETYLEESMNESIRKAYAINHNKQLDKLLDLINEQSQIQQDKMNVDNELKIIISQLQRQHGHFQLSFQESVKEQNRKIVEKFKKKVSKAKQALNKLIDILQQWIQKSIEATVQ